MRIDLHTHSSASDGTLTPAELVIAATAAGLDVVALTDHDTTAGWSEAIAAIPPGLTLVTGCELSCRMRAEGGTISLHLLAYLFDPAEPHLARARSELRDARERRAELIVAALQADGHPITLEQVRRLAGGGPVGRPHLAAALQEAGLITDIDEAFTPDWIGPGGRYRIVRHELDAVEAIRMVAAAGGASVFAHPYAARRGAIVSPADIAVLRDAGLHGIEAAHPDHYPGEVAALRGLAADLGLLVTGSSDFHGANRSQPLGAELTDPEDYERLIGLTAGQPVIAT